jgi:hypothetical protein
MEIRAELRLCIVLVLRLQSQSKGRLSYGQKGGKQDLLPLYSFFDRIKSIGTRVEETVHMGQGFESGAFDNVEDGHSCYAVFRFLEFWAGLDDHGASHTVSYEEQRRCLGGIWEHGLYKVDEIVD